MKKIILILTILAGVAVFYSCQEELPTLGNPPAAADASFTFVATDTSANVLILTNTAKPYVKAWDFGNGDPIQNGDKVVAKYPYKGTYKVKLTIYGKGGSVSSTQNIVIEKDEPKLLNITQYNLLTGGISNPNGKTWIIDATRAGHFGVGPNPSDPAQGDVPNYYSAGANEKPGTGLYNDEFTFALSGFKYTQQTNGDVYLNNKYAADFPGAFDNLGDKTAPFTAPTNLTWTLSGPTDNPYQNITISSGGFIGYYCGTSSYKIVSLSENEMIIRAVDAKDPALAWYQRLIPKGYTPPPPPPPSTATLPIDFEGAKPPFVGFGGSTYDVVANPSASGINTSAKVGKYVKGTEGNWAGIQVPLSSKIDFSTNKSFSYKVYSPVVGRALFKVETIDNSTPPVEVFADVTQVNQWQTLTFDFTGATSNVFNRISMFLDFDNNNGGTFYIDDIKQGSIPTTLTLAALTGGSSKTWILKPAAGSFGVGPSKGSDAYYPQGADLSSARPCLFNDEYIFKTGDVYQYDSKGDVFGEAYLGITPDGCQPESALGANAKAWGSGTHTFSFTPANGANPATITVTGTGAFIVLPKAKNGSEYSSGPPATNGSITYEVLGYTKNGTVETLTLTLQTNPGVYWTYVLTNK